MLIERKRQVGSLACLSITGVAKAADGVRSRLLCLLGRGDTLAAFLIEREAVNALGNLLHELFADGVFFIIVFVGVFVIGGAG